MLHDRVAHLGCLVFVVFVNNLARGDNDDTCRTVFDQDLCVLLYHKRLPTDDAIPILCHRAKWTSKVEANLVRSAMLESEVVPDHVHAPVP